MNHKSLIVGLASFGLALGAQAITFTFNFQEHGGGTLGNSSTFTEQGISLTATASPGQTLYAKTSGGDETGLGLTAESDHEIAAQSFIQLTLPTTPVSHLTSISFGSVQPGETATVWFSAVLGTLGAQIGTVTSDTSFDISSYSKGYIGISAGTGNVLIDSVTGFFDVADGGTTVTLLGGALIALGFARRKLIVQTA